MCSLVGTSTDLPTRGFMAWFGPKGVATMTFSLLILSENLRHGTTIFDLAALTVIVSVFAHGLTDRAGAEWMGAHAERAAVKAVKAVKADGQA
jgi:sodium/hydrogen antiporter